MILFLCSFLKGREAAEGDPDKRQLMDDLKVEYLVRSIVAGYSMQIVYRRSTTASTLTATVTRMRKELKSLVAASSRF